MEPDKRPRRKITAKAVLRLYGDISEMTLWRWIKNPARRFPQPILINGRRFFDEEAIADDQARFETDPGHK
jgi:predicted DNA-binding transcriptional regulator AlpA